MQLLQYRGIFCLIFLELGSHDTSYDINKRRERFGENYVTIFVYGNIEKSYVSSREVTFQLETYVPWNLSL